MSAENHRIILQKTFISAFLLLLLLFCFLLCVFCCCSKAIANVTAIKFSQSHSKRNLLTLKFFKWIFFNCSNSIFAQIQFGFLHNNTFSLSFVAIQHTPNHFFVMVQWISQLHNFIQRGLNSGSAYVQILFTACQRFTML